MVQAGPSYINVLGPIHTRFTVENSLGAWPGDNKHNCPLGYNCPDPVLLPVDPHGRKRWVDVGAGGIDDIHFTAVPKEDWVIVEPQKGTVKGDGTADVRVWLSVDWQKFPSDKETLKMDGHIVFNSSDGSSTTVTLPAVRGVTPAKEFRGAVQGDGYIAIEAAHCTSSSPARGKGSVMSKWEEIPYYGRTHSGMTILPPSLEPWGNDGPSMTYDFFVTHHDKRDVMVTLDFGPALNYILGNQLEISLQVDNGEVQPVTPVPMSKPGTVPDDWEEVVANEIRQMKLMLLLGNEIVGAHQLVVRGVRGGIVLERIVIDLGGVSARGKSYLGPPESIII